MRTMFGATRFSQAASAVKVKCSHMAKSMRPRVRGPEVRREDPVRRLQGQERVEDLAGLVRPPPEIEGMGIERGAVAVDLLVEPGAVVGLEDALDLVDVERGESEPGAAGLVDPFFGRAERGPRAKVLLPEIQDLAPALFELGGVDLLPAVIRGIEGDLDADGRGGPGGQVQVPSADDRLRGRRTDMQAGLDPARGRVPAFRVKLHESPEPLVRAEAVGIAEDGLPVGDALVDEHGGDDRSGIDQALAAPGGRRAESDRGRADLEPGLRILRDARVLGDLQRGVRGDADLVRMVLDPDGLARLFQPGEIRSDRLEGRVVRLSELELAEEVAVGVLESRPRGGAPGHRPGLCRFRALPAAVAAGREENQGKAART